jgi:hypothetical protein
VRTVRCCWQRVIGEDAAGSDVGSHGMPALTWRRDATSTVTLN